jgi:UDP-glucose 4-epimerase
MRYLITGAAGFLGSALANRLGAEGHSVIGYDDLSAGDAAALSADVQFVAGDVNDRSKLWSLLHGVDCVYHLAARVSVPESILYPREYNHVNVSGTVTIMEAMRDVGVRRVVFISSGTVYGNMPVQPVNEAAIPNPRSPYGVSKLAAEYYVRTIGALWGIEAVCLRVFNAYGPGQRIPPVHTPVIPNFLRQAWENGTIVIHGNGNQTRDYVYVDDVVEAMMAASTAEEVDRQIINVGSGTETTIRELAKLAVEVTGGQPEIVYNPRNEGGLSRLCADLTLARNKLGYAPRVQLVDGLRLTLEHDIQPQELNHRSELQI